jgi:hypothetical protein
MKERAMSKPNGTAQKAVDVGSIDFANWAGARSKAALMVAA